MSLLDTEHKMGRGKGAWSVCPMLIYPEIQSKQLSDLLNFLNTLRALCLFQMCKMP